jgi:hypothetical protein
LQAGVLLASRSGPLNEIEYSEFVQKVQALADAVGATPDAPDMLEVVARARELDALASPLDAQLSIRLRANGVAWSVAYVQQVAHKLGLVPWVPCRAGWCCRPVKRMHRPCWCWRWTRRRRWRRWTAARRTAPCANVC